MNLNAIHCLIAWNDLISNPLQNDRQRPSMLLKGVQEGLWVNVLWATAKPTRTGLVTIKQSFMMTFGKIAQSDLQRGNICDFITSSAWFIYAQILSAFHLTLSCPSLFALNKHFDNRDKTIVLSKAGHFLPTFCGGRSWHDDKMQKLYCTNDASLGRPWRARVCTLPT